MFTHFQFKKLATVKNANAWDETEDKFIFCLDLLKEFPWTYEVPTNAANEMAYWVECLELYLEEALDPIHPQDSCVPNDDNCTRIKLNGAIGGFQN